MTTSGIAARDFVRYAGDTGENTDVSVEVNADGVVGGRKITLGERIFSSTHRSSYNESWRRFSLSLEEAFGREATDSIIGGVDQNKPLTTRAIVTLTKKAQAAARKNAMEEFRDLDGDATAFSVFKEYQIADMFIELAKTDEFQSASPQEKLAIITRELMARHYRAESLPADQTPLGLERFSISREVFSGNETSVEALAATNRLRPGDRMGTDGSYVFLGLKEKGVEPGFLVSTKWTPGHDALVSGHPSNDPAEAAIQDGAYEVAGKTILDWVKNDTPEGILRGLTAFYNASAHNNQRLSVDSMERLLEMTPETCHDAGLLEEAKRIREDYAKWILRGGEPKAMCEPLMRDVRFAMLRLPQFKGKNIVKLDYNQYSRGLFNLLQLPRRIVTSVKKWFLYTFHLKTARRINEGAVVEAIANDLTRIFGAPAQKLQLVRASYSDGSPKLLLESEYVTGQDGATYRDLDYFIRDGYLDKSLMAAAGYTVDIRRLGAYKVILLLLGDRDGIGSHGQNKGFVGNSFAAIDPGHSLEGRDIKVDDDFSFSFSQRNPAESWFENFGVFDDCPLSEKMAGWDEIERQMSGEAVGDLFKSYYKQFGGVAAAGADLDFSERIGEIEDEVRTRFDHMQAVLAPRLELYRGENGPELLDALDNVEKLTSKTSATSPKGEVELDYLRVEERTAWDMQRIPGRGCVLSPRGVGGEAALGLCRDVLAMAAGAGGDGPLPFRVDDDGTITVNEERIAEFCALFTDKNVRLMKESAGAAAAT